MKEQITREEALKRLVQHFDAARLRCFCRSGIRAVQVLKSINEQEEVALGVLDIIFPVEKIDGV